MQDDNLPLVAQLVDQIFPSPPVLSIERVWEGVSTYVYRIRREKDVLYLRVLPEADASFAPEVLAHQLMRARQVHAPEVVYYEHKHAGLQRAVMVTAEIPGEAIGDRADLPGIDQIIRQAGRELALINRIEVDGFGWIRRDRGSVTRLQGEFSTHWEWVEHDMNFDITQLERGEYFRPAELHALPEVFDRFRTLFAEEQAFLAHGDFDATHIYQSQGVYTGIIDFGEIRGANALYDVGHFDIEHHELLPNLLEGYSSVTPLPTDHKQRIRLSGMFIALRRLERRLMQGKGAYAPDLAAVRRSLQALASE